jgi:predicted DNA-binding transcriptional regulator AlpA
MNYVVIPEKVWRKIERVLDKMDKEPVEWLNETEACQLLGIKKESMWSKVSGHKMPRSCYTIGVGGNRFYNKKALMGL